MKNLKKKFYFSCNDMTGLSELIPTNGPPGSKLCILGGIIFMI